MWRGWGQWAGEGARTLGVVGYFFFGGGGVIYLGMGCEINNFWSKWGSGGRWGSVLKFVKHMMGRGVRVLTSVFIKKYSS